MATGDPRPSSTARKPSRNGCVRATVAIVAGRPLGPVDVRPAPAPDAGLAATDREAR